MRTIFSKNHELQLNVQRRKKKCFNGHTPPPHPEGIYGMQRKSTVQSAVSDRTRKVCQFSAASRAHACIMTLTKHRSRHVVAALCLL